MVPICEINVVSKMQMYVLTFFQFQQSISYYSNCNFFPICKCFFELKKFKYAYVCNTKKFIVDVFFRKTNWTRVAYLSFNDLEYIYETEIFMNADAYIYLPKKMNSSSGH